MDTQKLVEIIVESLLEEGAKDIVSMDVSEKTAIANSFVICSSEVERHGRSLARKIEKKLKEEYQVSLYGRVGYESGRWVLMDYGDVIIHIFVPAEREYYQLEKYWIEKDRLK